MTALLITALILLCVAALALAGFTFLLFKRAVRLRRKVEREHADLLGQRDAWRQRLGQSQRMEAVGVYAGSIIHNLNNLLAVILGHAGLAAQAATEETRCKLEVDKVLQAGNLAGDLVRDLSDFYRQADMARKPLDLVPVVRDTLKLLQDILPRTIEIQTDLQTCGPVLASSTGVQQVLMNLCSNSVQAMLRGAGMIKVSLAEETVEIGRRALPHDLEPGQYVRLSVQDNGRGMDQATLDRITTSYFGDNTGLDRPGLGLATVCRILDTHQGVTIPSSRAGDGTTFTIFFPLIAWSVPVPEGKPASLVDSHIGDEEPVPLVEAEVAASNPVRILLVDDEEMVAEVMTLGLRRLGHEVTRTTESQRALEIFRKDPDSFDVVVTDQIMPHMSGVRLTKEIQNLRPGIPVILTTGFRDSFHERQAREAGVRDFILKPCSHHDMASLIQRVLVRRMEGEA